ncbi:MAG TPA: hypothetical protein VGO80_12605, partial [Solirubrobacteraceae bacterium]|nr:hypothetical protein [Solirubrobacteraceae bacterium]
PVRPAPPPAAVRPPASRAAIAPAEPAARAVRAAPPPPTDREPTGVAPRAPRAPLDRGVLDAKPLPAVAAAGSPTPPRAAQAPAAARPAGRAEAAQRLAAPARAEQPEHVVHVTIGRLEVRSATPGTPPAPGRASPRRPPVGLDDYLRERTEGRRR